MCRSAGPHGKPGQRPGSGRAPVGEAAIVVNMADICFQPASRFAREQSGKQEAGLRRERGTVSVGARCRRARLPGRLLDGRCWTGACWTGAC